MSSDLVLVLDDEAIIAFDLGDVVETTGRQLIGPAITISDARMLVSQQKPDAALLDINVKNETSWDLARELLSAGCKIIFFSADERPTDLDAAFENCRFLRKPASHDQIKAALDASLNP